MNKTAEEFLKANDYPFGHVDPTVTDSLIEWMEEYAQSLQEEGEYYVECRYEERTHKACQMNESPEHVDTIMFSLKQVTLPNDAQERYERGLACFAGMELVDGLNVEKHFPVTVKALKIAAGLTD